MAESAENRSRAAKLAKRTKAGKTLAPADATWLRAYKARVAAERAKQKAPIAFAMNNGRAVRLPAAEAKALASAPRVSVDEYTASAKREPEQLEMAAVVHETTPIEGAVTPDASTWIPETPPAAADAEPPPPGAPPPPAAGTPLVDEATATAGASSAAPDPAAAAQYTGIVVFIAAAGIASTLELLGDVEEIPPFIRAKLEDEQEHAKFLTLVGEATGRLVVKYNLRAVPMADEALVGATVVGSALAYLALQKKKKQAAGKAAAPQRPKDAPTPPREEPPAPPRPVSNLSRFLEPKAPS